MCIMCIKPVWPEVAGLYLSQDLGWCLKAYVPERQLSQLYDI